MGYERGGRGGGRGYGGGGGGYGGGGGGGRGYGGGGGGYGGGGGGGSRYESREAPVHAGDELDVTISDTAQKGDGIARVEGFIIFVPGAVKGEQCRIRVRDVRPRFATAEKVGGSASTEQSGGSTEAAPAETETSEEEGDETDGSE